MNKVCRNNLDKIKEQNYKLFLQNLLDKEEKAYRERKRINVKYYTYNKGGKINYEK